LIGCAKHCGNALNFGAPDFPNHQPSILFAVFANLSTRFKSAVDLFSTLQMSTRTPALDLGLTNNSGMIAHAEFLLG
jgi:alpha-D-ribose 1-methylphosphonate 5-triphosphate diphosphatase PhnM